MSWTFRSAVFIAASAVAGMALADDFIPSNLSVRAGLFFPESKAAKADGKTWFGIGFDYKLRDAKYRGYGNRMNESYSLSLDWMGRGGSSATPVLINYIGRSEQGYLIAGAGLAAIHVGGSTSNQFAYQLGYGMDFVRSGKAVFAELRYHGTGNSSLNGWALQAGMRF